MNDAAKLQLWLEDSFSDSEIDDISTHEGFEGAFVGVAKKSHSLVAIYDYNICIQILMNDGFPLEDAMTWIENLIREDSAESCPVFLIRKYKR